MGVHNMLTTGYNDQGICQLKQLLSEAFQMKDLGQLSYFLSLEIYLLIEANMLLWLRLPT